MSSIEQQGTGYLCNIFNINRGEFDLLHGEEKCPMCSDRWCFPQIHLHKLAGSQVRPSQAGIFEIALDVLMHTCEAEVPLVEANARFLARELDNVADARRLCGIDKHAL